MARDSFLLPCPDFFRIPLTHNDEEIKYAHPPLAGGATRTEVKANQTHYVRADCR